MNHLEEKVVIITSSVARQVAQDGTTRKYYRNNFLIEGKAQSVSSPDKLTGQVARVRFVKKDELGPTGVKIVQDAFSLIGSGTVAELREATAAKAIEAELTGLI